MSSYGWYVKSLRQSHNYYPVTEISWAIKRKRCIVSHLRHTCQHNLIRCSAGQPSHLFLSGALQTYPLSWIQNTVFSLCHIEPSDSVLWYIFNKNIICSSFMCSRLTSQFYRHRITRIIYLPWYCYNVNFSSKRAPIL